MKKLDTNQKIAFGMVSFIAISLQILVGIWVMTKGWGIPPQSYSWIIGGGLSTAVVAWLFAVVTREVIGIKDDDDEEDDEDGD